MRLLQICPVCGLELREGKCPNGHEGVKLELRLDNCEIRDLERFSLLPSSIQQLLLTAVESGVGPPTLYPLMVKLRDAGVVVCG